jgi:hypothetical protein
MTRIVKRTTTVVALIAALLAISAPMAAAHFDLNPPTGDPPAQNAPIEQPATHGVSSSRSGFSWGDAAIGAAFAFVALGLATTAVLATRRRRTATD